MDNTLLKRQTELEQLLQPLEQWEDRYKKIIELGKKLSPLPDDLKVPDNIVKGCQSQVWLVAQLDNQGLMHLKADSDALIVKGLVAIILHVYNESKPSEVLSTPPQFLKTLGLDTHLSPSRANGLRSMIQKIIYFAMAFETQLKAKG